MQKRKFKKSKLIIKLCKAGKKISEKNVALIGFGNKFLSKNRQDKIREFTLLAKSIASTK